MLREACYLASKNVDEAIKLENKGLIAQLVCVSLPLKSVGVWLPMLAGAGRSSLPSAEEGVGHGLLSFLGQGPSDDGWLHVGHCYHPGSLV